ncbi:GNAT family N-acetyltransferase [Kibdelosporangium phytohabitans]|uniref:N-acetyltransferase domain-containing protein n=1 Tax=Kibdelosporangium phytohabitans TaxID=860235 RepID=A0A0N9IB66_9PSEU|nr:GNAT family N-acetyltransferase [Kibdelosporangium phytohabitans]ALG12061.1 hypothetical protein AOZ06_38965 [Kibdelosporangium phytohabitans]MBE1463543.1 ribosomal protein S18 acetylase RimI-like enzyme [Kibdelosporangium phytohabitans]
MTEHLSPLDNPVWTSLNGPHAHLAEKHGRALRYPVDVAPFLAVPDRLDEAVWRDAAELAGAGEELTLTGPHTLPPDSWQVADVIPGVQLVDDGIDARPDREAVRLGRADVPEMIDLVRRTRPGPFLPRTIELGTYLGIRRDGKLVAMAGERLRPPGWTEISAVCTDPAFRGNGLATRLVLAVAAGIADRGEIPFLHTGAANTGAIRLYESLGFRLRHRPDFVVARVPSAAEQRRVG